MHCLGKPESRAIAKRGGASSRWRGSGGDGRARRHLSVSEINRPEQGYTCSARDTRPVCMGRRARYERGDSPIWKWRPRSRN